MLSELNDVKRTVLSSSIARTSVCQAFKHVADDYDELRIPDRRIDPRPVATLWRARHQLKPCGVLVHECEALKVGVRRDAHLARVGLDSRVARVVQQPDRAKVAPLEHVRQRPRRQLERRFEARQQCGGEPILA